MTNYQLLNDELMAKLQKLIWKLFIVISFVIVISAFGIPSHASSVIDPTEIGVGARPLGMGKAFNSVADDGSALFMNPAGLTAVDKFSIISMSGNLINEVPYMMLGGAWRAPAGVIGIGYVGASTDGIKEAILVGSTPEVTGNTANFGATTFVLSYANEAEEINYINKINFLTDRNAKVGANLKLVTQGFSGGASFEGGSASGFDIDLGTIIPINETINSSVTIKNIIPGNNVGSDELPMSIIGGLSVKYPERNLLTAYDAEINQEGFLLHLGVEWNPVRSLFLRAGIDQKADAYNLALGLGTKFRGFTFDYAYHTYAELSEFTTHYFSIGFVGPEGNL